ncbi:MAG: hypothetical protein HY015_08710 [Bacteroidetes bacterium]|nr:hypothetical protein [Bacteroidota bacterium]MBI3483037.1 hypothetical protein [Bacteroidota bacterium]
MKILLVEDKIGCSDLLKALLEAKGHSVEPMAYDIWTDKYSVKSGYSKEILQAVDVFVTVENVYVLCNN